MGDQQVAIVTGAGSGIGREIATQLAREGYAITLVGRRETPLAETAAMLKTADGRPAESLVIPADIGNAQAAASVIEQTVGRWGRLDALVNNAGRVEFVGIERTDPELLERMFTVNTYGPAMLIGRAWPVFRQQARGCVVNVSSMATVDPYPGLYAYAASKAAVESFVRSIATEGGEQGIRAYAVAPGAVETNMLRANISEDLLPRSATLDPAQVARTVVNCVLGRADEASGGRILMPSS